MTTDIVENLSPPSLLCDSSWPAEGGGEAPLSSAAGGGGEEPLSGGGDEPLGKFWPLLLLLMPWTSL